MRNLRRLLYAIFGIAALFAAGMAMLFANSISRSSASPGLFSAVNPIGLLIVLGLFVAAPAYLFAVSTKIFSETVK